MVNGPKTLTYFPQNVGTLLPGTQSGDWPPDLKLVNNFYDCPGPGPGPGSSDLLHPGPGLPYVLLGQFSGLIPELLGQESSVRTRQRREEIM